MVLKSVTFDLDGTLLDTIADLAAACDAMLVELGRSPLGVERVRRFVGKGMAVLVERCLTAVDGRAPDAGLQAAAVASFRHHYAGINGREAVEYPGVRAGLEAFRALGLPLGVVTNKPAAFTGPLLARMGIAGYFGATVSGDTLPEKKPHPAPLFHACELLGVPAVESLMIGDSANDAEAARAAGMPVLLVTYGYSEGVAVDSIDCDGLLSSLVDALPRIR